MISLGRPFHVLPKTTTLDILVQNKRVAFLDPLFFKRRQGFSNERPRNTLSSVFSLNNEMTQNASPALMATHHSGDDAVIRTGDEAEPLIPLQVDSCHGFWLFVRGKEYFLPYEEYPWFKEARIADIINVELLHDFHIHWPGLDVDLSLTSLEDPSKTPLVYRP